MMCGPFLWYCDKLLNAVKKTLGQRNSPPRAGKKMNRQNAAAIIGNVSCRALPQRLAALYLCFGLFLICGDVARADRYVWSDSPTPGAPYDTWANAAHDVQTAVTAASAETVWVTNECIASQAQSVWARISLFAV